MADVSIRDLRSFLWHSEETGHNGKRYDLITSHFDMVTDYLYKVYPITKDLSINDSHDEVKDACNSHSTQNEPVP